jgi:cytochrome b561
MNTPIMQNTRYSATAIALHWLMAAAFIGLFALGVFMSDMPLSPQKLKLYSWHKWAGVTLFSLAWIRLFWRLTHRPPALPETMSRNLRLIAHIGHGMLYFLMFAVPLSGWLMSSAKGFPTVLFGVLPIPDLLQKNKELGDILQTVHGSLNLLFALIVIGHIAAALKHHFINHDDILIRISPHHKKPDLH